MRLWDLYKIFVYTVEMSLTGSMSQMKTHT